MTAKQPFVRAAVFCSSVRVDSQGRDSVLGISDGVKVHARKIPRGVERIELRRLVFLWIDCAPGWHTLLLRYRNPLGHLLPGEGRSDGDVGANANGFRLTPLTKLLVDIGRPGRYALEIVFDGKFLGDIPLQVSIEPRSGKAKKRRLAN